MKTRVFDNIQLKIALTLIIILSAISVSILYFVERDQKVLAEDFITEQLTENVDSYFDSLNTLMITGSMEEREILRKKYLSRKNIISAKVIRGDAVKEDYGVGFESEQVSGELEERALKGEQIRVFQELEGKRVLTVINPFMASKNYRGTNCLDCHNTKEGTVLGAVKISYSMESIDGAIINNIDRMEKVFLISFVAGLLALGGLIRHQLIKRVQRMRNEIALIESDADLTRVIPNKYRDELGVTINSFNSMIDKFRKSMEEVFHATEEITTGTKTINDAFNETLENTLKQSDQIHEISLATDDMSSKVDLVNSNAARVSESAQVMNDEMESINQMTLSAKESIQELNKHVLSSEQYLSSFDGNLAQVGQVITLIEQITAKLKFLSFNASIEAEKAGDNAKGFRVVAEEIGSLADDTRGNLKQIGQTMSVFLDQTKALLENFKQTKELSEQGSTEVEQSANGISDLAARVSEVSSMNNQIARSSSEQSEAIKTIADQVSSIKELSLRTQQSAVECGEISRGFMKLTTKLAGVVKRFKI